MHNLQRTEKVVFHCALSQERGPSAALRYIRERERLVGQGSVRKAGEVADEERDSDGKVKKQEVLVLDGGFTEWQEKYGEDESVTEGFRKELWR